MIDLEFIKKFIDNLIKPQEDLPIKNINSSMIEYFEEIKYKSEPFESYEVFVGNWYSFIHQEVENIDNLLQIYSSASKYFKSVGNQKKFSKEFEYLKKNFENIFLKEQIKDFSMKNIILIMWCFAVLKISPSKDIIKFVNSIDKERLSEVSEKDISILKWCFSNLEIKYKL